MKRQPKISNQIALKLAEAIRGGQFEPGENLPGQKLADMMGVSRQPIVDALKMLEKQGIVELRPNRGFFVGAHIAKVIAEKIGDLKQKGEETYFRIAEDRLIGQLPDEVTVSDLQRIYRISRNQAQSILARMAQEGWIVQKPGYGWRFLPTLTSPVVYRHSYEFRILIEPAALRSPDYRVKQKEFEIFRDRIVRNIDSHFKTFSPAEQFKMGCEFHEMIVGCCGNPFFLDALKRINQLRRLIEYSKYNRARFTQQSKEHVKLLDLLLEGRQAEAADFLKLHLENIRNQKSFNKEK